MAQKGPLKTLLFYYVINVIAYAMPLACFEVWLERHKTGWNGHFKNPYWEEQINIPGLNRIFEKAYLTRYHYYMFGGVYVIISLAEYTLAQLVFGAGWPAMTVAGTKIVPILFLTAVWLGNAVFEDMLWFLLNSFCPLFSTRFPDAVARLCRGDFSWHTKWVTFTPSFKLPRFYFTSPIIVGALLWFQWWLVR